MNNLLSNFSKAKVWSETNDIPVMLSEFGAIKFCDYNSRMKHYAAYVEQSMEHNFIFNAWNDGDGFRIYQRQTREWNEIKDILIDYSSRHPVYFNVLNNNGDEVELSWENRLAECDSIFIRRGTDLSDLKKIAAVTADIDTYVDNSVERNKNYYYKVVSYRQDTVELYSYPQKVFTDYVSLNQKINDIPIRIYPNPAKNTITIQLVNSFSECEISIVDAKGKLRITKIITSQEENLDLAQLEPGIYILTLRLNNMEYSTEISKN